ncbi:YicC/YloC family endoribonuclease [Paenibacillus hamazuiensis]|uniref:YicC/YloC family endoribonuclease n=1 Tax=Paenibacillus hamazuiensis TaxID=2936508 RepID=UPI00200D8C9E|nr:YicC/YloC family endoribonuclease [Paenibacillus hamazuiensis]
MIRSMTGFGQANRLIAGYRVQIDAKSVNHRYCEAVIRLPREWLALEDPLKKTVQLAVKRGRIDLFVSIERENAPGKAVSIDWSLAEGIRQAAGQLKERFGLTDAIGLKELLQFPDVVKITDKLLEADDTIVAEFQKCAEAALERLTAMREAEGRHLRADLLQRLDDLEEKRREMRRFAPLVVQEYAQKLRQRIQELLSAQTAVIDEQRLAMEVAIFADRANVDEELTRLESHFLQFRSLLDSGEPAGRQLDFLVQEMNREVNTIGSKAGHVELTGRVVSMKAELEKIREQVQNIE